MPYAPTRTRRYSPRDIDRLHRIGQLLTGGLNLAGIELVLALEADNADLRTELGQAIRNQQAR